MGDRLVWRDVQKDYRFSVLACDDDLFTTGNGFSTHPNEAGVWENQVLQDSGVTGFKNTLSRWLGPGTARGPMDLNFAMDDGSAMRLRRVSYEPYSQGTESEDKVVPVPYISKAFELTFYRHLPVQW